MDLADSAIHGAMCGSRVGRGELGRRLANVGGQEIGDDGHDPAGACRAPRQVLWRSQPGNPVPDRHAGVAQW